MELKKLDVLIKNKKNEMYKHMDKYGRTDARTVKVSQALDVLIAKKQKQMLNM